jgi:cellulose synthase/poly-beta-1,6-N-acetylglucosamine synthase-like glycosyltransferase
MSAYATLTAWQRRLFIAVGSLLLLSVVAWPLQVALVLCGLATALYVVVFVYRLLIFWQVLSRPPVETVSDEEAEAIPDPDLPVYTVLVPAYREPEVIANTLAAIDRLRYPRDRLDVILILEEDDAETFAAVIAAHPAPHVRVITVPSAPPQTKPKACNYGQTYARGELVTIYDAEDRPEPLQLRRAVAAFRRHDSSLGCVQAKLSYHNVEQNIITRWFTAEYVGWFGGLLPALVAQRAPVPLGGTSMHLKRDVLEHAGGWDAHNVTEDADLGVRLHRRGYRTLVLESTTFEEANSDFVNWVKQRSRWYKGYLQTWLVHTRHPVRLWKDLGWRGWLAFHLVIGGTPFIALINPVFWTLLVLWIAGKPAFVAALFPGPIYYPAMFCLAIGNFLVVYTNLAIVYTNMVVVRQAGQERLLLAILLVPGYWVMMSIAAVKAALQLIISPWHWEKTTHGLDQPAPPGLNPVDGSEVAR